MTSYPKAQVVEASLRTTELERCIDVTGKAIGELTTSRNN